MTQRLQVLLDDEEFAEIGRVMSLEAGFDALPWVERIDSELSGSRRTTRV